MESQSSSNNPEQDVNPVESHQIQSGDNHESAEDEKPQANDHYDDSDYSGADEPLNHYDFEDYIHYNDFAPNSQLTTKIHIYNTQKSDWGNKVIPKAKLFDIAPSTRKNKNAANSLQTKGDAQKMADAPWNRNTGNWYNPRGEASKKFKTCVHSPITPTDCRICGNSYVKTKKFSKTGHSLPARKIVISGAVRVVEKPITRKRRQECDCDTKCQLDTRKCCACMDKRPIRGTYWAYFDGYGYRQTVKRNVFYCPGCNGSSQETATVGSEDPVKADVENSEVAEDEGALVSENSGVNTQNSLKSEPTTSHTEPEQTFDAGSEISFDVLSITSPQSMSSWSNISNINNPKAFLKSCGHECCLKLPAKCCGCSDERPVEETYWVYLVQDSSDFSYFNMEQLGYDSVEDGVLVETSRRDQLYCEYCKSNED
ncbi:hypothetical protein HK098_003112 [Nowakowskiella sp. JEL0407]|nr:hypothetical protein HK098_003112 [Nowakowskiella sp. JEL0407]